MERTRERRRRKDLLNAEIRSLIGPCLISFSIPLFVPGLTITLVAFSDETGFSKYGPLHVIGILILTIACILLVVGCVMKCTCKSKINPLMMLTPQHKVTTHEKPKPLDKFTVTAETTLPPLTRHPQQPSGSQQDNARINRILTNPRRDIDSDTSDSDSDEDTTSDSEDSGTQSMQTKYGQNVLPPVITNDLKPCKTSKESSFKRSNGKTPSRNVDDLYNKLTEGSSDPFISEQELLSRKTVLKSKAFTDMHNNGNAQRDNVIRDNGGIPKTNDTSYHQHGTKFSSSETKFQSGDIHCRTDDERYSAKDGSHGKKDDSCAVNDSGYPADDSVSDPSPADDTDMVSSRPVTGWMSRQSHDKSSRGSKFSSETPSSSGSSETAIDGRETADGDDVTLTSRNCSTIPEIADIDQDDCVEVDRFQNEWREGSGNSVEISSVLSQDEYSEESLSVVSKDQVAERSGSRGRASSDSAMESGGDHSRALSQRYTERQGTSSDLIPEDVETPCA